MDRENGQRGRVEGERMDRERELTEWVDREGGLTQREG